MYDALHPTCKRMISYHEYLEFAVLNNFQKPNDAPGARCPICKRELKVRAGQTKDDGHFYHKDDLYCPTKDPASRPYLRLYPVQADPKIAEANIAFARAHIRQIYTKLCNIISFLDFKEFIAILKEARRLNVYGYANMVPEYLPYVYVTLINFFYQKTVKIKQEN
jgi:hypothetical protein